MFGLSRLSPIQLIVLAALGLIVLGSPLQRAASDPERFIQWFVAVAIALVVGITVHEASHATVAVALGDPTPRLMGRVSLNPLRHLDPLGSLMILIASFGWGKPVMFDPSRLKGDPRLGSALVAVAGPVSNILVALVAVLALASGVTPAGPATQVVQTILGVNVALAAFNLLPIPPLDGFGFVENLLPKPMAQALAPIVPYGPLILLALIFLGPSVFHVDVLGLLMSPIQNAILSFLRAAARMI
jgi:Zn-dependent protease